MCIAVPGRVISIEGNIAKVDFSGSVVHVNAGAVSAAIGEYVLVHAGCAIEVLDNDQARELLDIFAELESIAD